MWTNLLAPTSHWNRQTFRCEKYVLDLLQEDEKSKPIEEKSDASAATSTNTLLPKHCFSASWMFCGGYWYMYISMHAYIYRCIDILKSWHSRILMLIIMLIMYVQIDLFLCFRGIAFRLHLVGSSFQEERSSNLTLKNPPEILWGRPQTRLNLHLLKKKQVYTWKNGWLEDDPAFMLFKNKTGSWDFLHGFCFTGPKTPPKILLFNVWDGVCWSGKAEWRDGGKERYRYSTVLGCKNPNTA